MEFAVHMKNEKTGDERIKKVVAGNVNNAACKGFYYGSGQVQDLGTMFLITWSILAKAIKLALLSFGYYG